MSKKDKCCKSFKKKGKACRDCPLMKALSKKECAFLVKKYRK